MARWGRCDFRQLVKMQERLQTLQQVDIDTFCKEVSKELAARLLRKVIKRTPVGKYPQESGKKGGTLRRGWTATTEDEAKTGSGKGKNVKEYVNNLNVRKTGNNYTIDIINPVEYGIYVEFGHRTKDGKKWIPGRLMLTTSEMELESQLDKIIEKKLLKFIGDYINGN